MRELQGLMWELGMRPLVAGNWKMNGLAASLGELAALKDALIKSPPACDVLVCPPATLIAQAAWHVKGAFALGGQDCRAEASGAFTGDLSAEMLKDAGASYVIVGHSERRQYHGESNTDVAAKAQAAWRAGLSAIICLGETQAQRDAGDASHICSSQLDASVPDGATPANTAIAYEPVWAIGTGRTPTNADIIAMHAHIRACLIRRLGESARSMLILYGGSVKPDNANQILNLPEVGGALVGGASLKAPDFLAIIGALKPV
jgi:triosephosphate isomerase